MANARITHEDRLSSPASPQNLHPSLSHSVAPSSTHINSTKRDVRGRIKQDVRGRIRVSPRQSHLYVTTKSTFQRTCLGVSPFSDLSAIGTRARSNFSSAFARCSIFGWTLSLLSNQRDTQRDTLRDIERGPLIKAILSDRIFGRT